MIRCFDDKVGYLPNVNGIKISYLKSLMVATTQHQKKRRFSTNYPTSIVAASAAPLISGQVTRDSNGPYFYQDVCNSFFWRSDFMESNYNVVILSYCLCVSWNKNSAVTSRCARDVTVLEFTEPRSRVL